MSLVNCVLVNKTSAQVFTRATDLCNQACKHSEGIVHTMSVRLKKYKTFRSNVVKLCGVAQDYFDCTVEVNKL